MTELTGITPDDVPMLADLLHVARQSHRPGAPLALDDPQYYARGLNASLEEDLRDNYIRLAGS
jgi:hypothetical protein